MLSPRTLTRRALGLLGLALLVLTGIAATLWWMLFHRPDWIGYLPDTKTRLIDRTVERIYRARLQVPSADANENGTPDWYEVFWGRDPRPGDAFDGMVRVHNSFLYRGERTSLRLVYEVSSRFDDGAWPIHMEVTIKATTPILLSADAPVGTPPTTGPLRVKLSRQGRLEFDVLLFEDQLDQVEIAHARSGVSLTDGRAELFCAHGWRLASQSSHVERQLLNDVFDAGPAGMNGPSGPPRIMNYLVWEPHPDPRVDYILEAARADLPDEWIGFARIAQVEERRKMLGNEDRDVFPGYTGPLLYRVIAISDRRPATPDNRIRR